jgi:hypothetical protein
LEARKDYDMQSASQKSLEFGQVTMIDGHAERVEGVIGVWSGGL